MIKNTRKSQREKEKEIYFFGEFVKLQQHFFRDILKHLKRVKDPRHKSYTKYDSDVILFTLLMKNACCVLSMSNMTEKFNKEECIENISQILGNETLEDLPHREFNLVSGIPFRECLSGNIFLLFCFNFNHIPYFQPRQCAVKRIVFTFISNLLFRNARNDRFHLFILF